MALPSGAIPGVDVSHYQAVVDWITVSGNGKLFGYAKASEGGTVSDPYFADNWAGIKTAGLLRGAYHFYHPGIDPLLQVNNFLTSLAKGNGGARSLAAGDLPAALDIEVTDGVPPPTILAGALAWLQAVEAATGKQPIVYTYSSFWQSAIGNSSALSSYPLWIAHYDVAAPTLPGGWTKWLFWQFAQQSLAGVPAPVTDLNAFNGSLVDLQKLAV